jgi:hypothetical protein
MTYTLELNHYNPTENLFFQATNIATPAQFTEYITPILDKHKAKGTWTDNTAWDSRTFDRYQREGTGWQRIVRINHFVSVAVAVEFFKDLVADGTEYRRLLRAWHQLHGILAEANVLDETGEIAEVIHACQAHKCIRFGSCPSEVSGCATVPKHTHDGIYPIYHLDKV